MCVIALWLIVWCLYKHPEWKELLFGCLNCIIFIASQIKGVFPLPPSSGKSFSPFYSI